ncbi:MAG: hypothetical protein KGH75_00315 [Rhodospirillales bacterium]|nr:hypothetical protein [Rhodospirillales bacterium]
MSNFDIHSQLAFAKIAEGAGVDEALVRVIAGVMQEHDDARVAILEAGESATRRAAEQAERIAAGHHVSPFGNLGETGIKQEVACALYESTARTLVRLSNLVPEDLRPYVLGTVGA